MTAVPASIKTTQPPSLGSRRMIRVARVALALMCLVLGPWHVAANADDQPVRGVLIRPQRMTPDLAREWKSKGANSIVVLLDASNPTDWPATTQAAKTAGLDLWAWVEVGRNPKMADDHPTWMASPGSHHKDWRTRFPDAPVPRKDEVVKVWPWVPIGYEPAFEEHQRQVNQLLDQLPRECVGIFLNDLQAGPSSCGCGNDQCRWALDYGSASTAPKLAGDDIAARFVQAIRRGHPALGVIPVWVTECENADLPGEPAGTGHCGGVPCAKGACWPNYLRAWNPLLASGGPIALGAWSGAFRRDNSRWPETALTLFQNPPNSTLALPPERTITVVQGWGQSQSTTSTILERLRARSSGWVVSLDPIEQSWEPRVVATPLQSPNPKP